MTHDLRQSCAIFVRKPLRWKGANPLSFIGLFKRGRQLRLLAAATMMQSAFDQHSTHRYTEMHQQQMLGWDLNQRGRYASYRGVFSIFASCEAPPLPAVHATTVLTQPCLWCPPPADFSGPIMSAIGMPASLVLGYGAEAFEQFCTAFSTRGWHFYASRPARGGAGGTDMTPRPALVYAGNLYR